MNLITTSTQIEQFLSAFKNLAIEVQKNNFTPRGLSFALGCIPKKRVIINLNHAFAKINLERKCSEAE
ncbi:MAG: hypothetical protein DRR16_08365 [Candidatus Parabeggiatoa sp. nov. 3]|nr:MAG: hypothetical protein DRR00_14005 [Gammaproteobacteria bacterium]RKZ66218.1 MAG: hypothetical protein DRQ99_10355 [Gammaproteobacteria bacterium]RKZ86978.1 MAG: hypothetical protein DRR16_08365 [Gammaproteobacteria bacterium]